MNTLNNGSLVDGPGKSSEPGGSLPMALDTF